MDLGIEGRRALIGGASSGLGRAAAEALAAEGCRLAIWSRSRERLEPVGRELEARHGLPVTILTADAGDPTGAALDRRRGPRRSRRSRHPGPQRRRSAAR